MIRIFRSTDMANMPPLIMKFAMPVSPSPALPRRERGVKSRFASFTSNLPLLLLVVTAMQLNSVYAADEKKEGKEQARRLQQKVNAIEQEKSQLLQSKTQLEGQLKDSSEKFSRAKRSADAANRKISELEKTLQEAETVKTEQAAKLVTTEQKLAETEKLLAETSTTLHQTQIAKSQLESSLTKKSEEFTACTVKNESLHRLGGVLIKQYQEKSCLNSLLAKEPLTQLKKVEVENMVDEYREKIDQELVEKNQTARLDSMRQKREEEFAALHTIRAQQEEQELAEKKEAVRAKNRQQNDLDQLSRKVKAFFADGFEWF
jgi:hypothetical protein